MKKFDQHIKDNLSKPQAPPLDAWANIERHLDQKKKRKLIPIWFSASAASVAILVGVYFYSKDENKSHPKTPEFVKYPVKNQSTKQNNRSIILDENIKTNDELVKSSPEKDKSNHQNNKYIDVVYAPKFVNPNLILEYKTIQNQDTLKINQTKINTDLVKSNLNELPKIIKENNTIKKEQSIEEFILEKEQKNKFTDNKKKESKLMVSSFVSPTVLINKNSMLSEEFDMNTIENQLTATYGASVSYQITENLKISGGIAKVNLDQITKNVIATEPIVSLLDVNTIDKSRKQHIRYSSPLKVTSANNTLISLNQTANSNQMNQRLEFVEIPLEVEYNLLKKNKFSVAAVGGGSYYLLTKNDIVLSNPTSGNRTLGKATNINDSHFSANAGIKIGYDASQSINVNLQPNFKFLMNQFDDSQLKSPTLFGINLGISFKIK